MTEDDIERMVQSKYMKDNVEAIQGSIYKSF